MCKYFDEKGSAPLKSKTIFNVTIRGEINPDIAVRLREHSIVRMVAN